MLQPSTVSRRRAPSGPSWRVHRIGAAGGDVSAVRHDYHRRHAGRSAGPARHWRPSRSSPVSDRTRSSGLPPACASRRFRRGEVIFHLGDPGDALFVIVAGDVKISLPSETGEEAILATLGAGDVFGELALLDGAPARRARRRSSADRDRRPATRSIPRADRDRGRVSATRCSRRSRASSGGSRRTSRSCISSISQGVSRRGSSGSPTRAGRGRPTAASVFAAT